MFAHESSFITAEDETRKKLLDPSFRGGATVIVRAKKFTRILERKFSEDKAQDLANTEQF
jgi:hypothetical protein